MLACSVLRRALSQRGPARAAAATADVYSPLRMVACVLPSARHAAVAYDVARLCLIAEKRPDTDLRLDEGTHHPPDAYLCDQLFKDLLASRTSFADVCEALRSGALADQFLCAAASPDRQSRRAVTHLTDEPHAASSQGGKLAAAAESQSSGQAGEGSPQQATTEPVQHSLQGQSPAQAPGASPEDPLRPRRKPMRWTEWPVQGGGQFVSCISERAMKGNMSLPSRMKQELFQTSEEVAQIEAHDLQPGSSLRWVWEVRDYFNPKDIRTATYISNLGSFFRHFGAEAGDVMVVVASAPGLVRATVWKGGSQDALRFKAIGLEEQQGNQREGPRPSGGRGAGRKGKKRQAEGAATQRAASKVARRAAVAAGASVPARGGSAAQATDAGWRQAAGHRPGAAAPPPSQQPSAPAPPQLQARLLSGELARAAAAGGEPSGALDELQQLSPTGQVVQSPFRNQLLHPLPSPSVDIMGEQPVPPPPARAAGASPGHPADDERVGAADAERAAPHSPARVSCASPRDPEPQRTAAAAQLAASAGAVRQAESGSELPDAQAIVDDDNAVFRAMACLLKLVASSGQVPPALVSKFRRSFGGVEPAGRRWYIYDSLHQLVCGEEWAEVRHWLQGE